VSRDSTARPEWRQAAACRGRDDVDWFPDATDLKGLARAQLVCRGCPVKDECADHAFVVGEKFGVWAGVNVGIATDAQLRERKRAKNAWRARQREQRRTGPLVADDDPRHGTLNGYTNLGCKCDRCREVYATYHREHRQRETG
jgi:hypothetical protein